MKWALLLAYDRGAGTVRLHDVVRKFLLDRAGPDGLARQAQALVAAYANTTGADLSGPERLYYYRHLPQHLHAAGDHAKLDALLMSPAWMQAKLAATDPRSLIDDYRYAHTEGQRLTGQTLRLAGGVLTRDKCQLSPQLLGRMRAGLAEVPAEAIAIDALLQNGRALVTPPILAPRLASLTPPGGPELHRFEGHTGSVRAVAFSPDGRHIVSGSEDRTLRLWEVEGGAARVLEGHTSSVRAVAFSPDGRHIASASDDCTLRLWKVESGVARVLEGHTGSVWAVAFSPDGRHIVSGSGDRTLRLWEVERAASRMLEATAAM